MSAFATRSFMWGRAVPESKKKEEGRCTRTSLVRVGTGDWSRMHVTLIALAKVLQIVLVLQVQEWCFVPIVRNRISKLKTIAWLPPVSISVMFSPPNPRTRVDLNHDEPIQKTTRLQLRRRRYHPRLCNRPSRTTTIQSTQKHPIHRLSRFRNNVFPAPSGCHTDPNCRMFRDRGNSGSPSAIYISPPRSQTRRPRSTLQSDRRSS